MAEFCKIRITNLDALSAELDRMPKQAMAITRKSARTAASAVARKIRTGMKNSRFKNLIRSKVKVSRGGATFARMGAMHTGVVQGHQNKNYQGGGLEDWWKAYWLNYGTLQNRDKSHKFDRPIKAQSRRKKGGIAPRHFFDPALEGWNETFVKKFQEEFSKNIDQLMK